MSIQNDSSKMKIIESTKEQWDAFVDASPQGTVFNKSFFLESYEFPAKYLLCSKGSEKIAGFAAVETPEGIRLMSYQVYNGLLFKDFSQFKAYRQHETCFLAMEALASYLFEHYAKIDFLNHWDIQDWRAFDWLNFSERGKGYFKVSLNYTSHLDISDPLDISGYASGRVWDLNKTKDGVKWETKESGDVALLIHLHDMNFQKQGVSRSAMAQKCLPRLCESLLNAKAAKLYVTYQNGEPAVASLFAYDRFRAYYLVVGTDSRYVDCGVGTKNLHEACVLLHDTLNINKLDLVGINSPQRGKYKLSYGGNIVPYYQVVKIKPDALVSAENNRQIDAQAVSEGEICR